MIDTCGGNSGKEEEDDGAGEAAAAVATGAGDEVRDSEAGMETAAALRREDGGLYRLRCLWKATGTLGTRRHGD